MESVLACAESINLRYAPLENATDRRCPKDTFRKGH